MSATSRWRWQIMVVRLIQAAVCLPLGAMSAISLSEEIIRANAGATTLESGLVTTLVVVCYFAIPVIAFKSFRAASLLGNVFCIIFTPYVAFLLFFSGWSVPSENA